MNSITDWEIVDHGIEAPDYFQGCGVSGTQFRHVQTGIGATRHEALMDATDEISMCGNDTALIEEQNPAPAPGKEGERAEEDTFWHVSIRYNSPSSALNSDRPKETVA